VTDGDSDARHLPRWNGAHVMNLRPLHDRMSVQRIEDGEQKIGIIIPDTVKEEPQQGTVIAVGNRKPEDDGTRIPLDAKANGAILFGKYSGQEITIDGDAYRIRREDGMLAVIDEAATKKT
jgi:chaperonin GroES